VGDLLRGRYEPLEVVGKGGEGEVIRALDHLHDRQVALKVRRVSGDESRAELLSEARVLLALTPHPGLPLVREDFFVDDRYFIAMDWIEGTDLDALLVAKGRPGLGPALAIGYLEQAAGALEHLHTHDPPVVHGDVKPANLILTSSGRIVLVDFGLSSTPSDEVRRSGTAGFTAPEVAAGLRPEAGADVYSLAATAVALLTGEPPAAAPGWGAIEPDRVRALERIVRRSLAADPSRRDPSAAGFVARLARWWGAELPRGMVTLVLTDAPEDEMDEIVRAHSGHCTAPANDGPLLAAFASATDGFDAARALAGRLGARVAAVTADAAPRAGSYSGGRVASLLEQAGRGQLVIDDATASAIGGRLPPEVGLAETRYGWVVVAPGLEVPERAASCPYRGLMAFGPDDGDLFFGREEVVASILVRLLDGGFMAIVGASGSGKSSLVRAGIASAWTGRVVAMTPGSDPTAELERALAGAPPSLLIVDQLEELFTLCPDEEQQSVFVNALMDAGRSTAIVVTLRADFYGKCANLPRLAAAFAQHQHLLGPMSTDELRHAIERPARAAGLRLEPGLVETMLADVAGEPGALPLLSHALYESWARRDGRVLTRAGYIAAGGVRGAIANTAEEVFLACSDDERTAMRRMFLRLTEPGETTEDTRRRVPLDELMTEDEAAAVLERLAAARLLVLGDDSAEIAHEALIREWPKLRGWLAQDREALRALRQLTSAARVWEDSARNGADLYRGPRLAAALELAGGEWQLSRAEREFLDAGEEAQDRELRTARRRTRRLRALLAVVASALVAAVIAGVLALVQRGHARHSAIVAQAGRLAAQSREAAPSHPDLALLLALEAGRLNDSVETRGALLGALEHASRIRRWLQGFAAPVNTATFSPDGKLLATVTHDGTTLWNTTTWRPVGAPLRSRQGGWEWADFSPDGRTLAIAGGRGRVELWDVATRKEIRELRDPAAVRGLPALAVVRFSPDGRVIAAGGQQTNHVTLWNAKTGLVIGRPLFVRQPGSGAQAIAFTPDSKRIAVPGPTGTVGIWDVATGRRVGKPLTIGTADVADVLFAPGGRRLVASDDAGAVSFVDVATGRPLRAPLSVGGPGAGALALSPDGRLLAAGSFDGPIVVWDAKTGDPYGPLLTADTSPPNGIAFSPDGRTLVTSHLRSAVVWNMDGRQVIGEPVGGRTDVISDIAFSPDGKRFAAAEYDRPTVVYDTATRRAVLRIGGGGRVSAIAFEPNGRRIAVADLDGHIRLFDATTGAPVGPRIGSVHAPIWQLAFSPDGRLLAMAVDPNGEAGYDKQRRDGFVQLVDVRSGRRIARPILPRAGTVLSVAFSRDGKLLATGSYSGRVDLWNVATQARNGRSMTFVDDGAPSVAFDPAGRLVASGGGIGPIRVWRVADQRLAFPPLPGHNGGVTGIAFDSSGSLLASSSGLGDTRLWDPATGLGYGDELDGSARPKSLQRDFSTLAFLGLRNAFSPNGKLLAVAGFDKRPMLWSVDPLVWRRRACDVVGRNLTRQEWKLYVPSGMSYRATCPQWPLG
jgi:WD40 repeat protein/tRNA A-37 threonylcarbamoyl transferase component Bud32